MEIAWNTLNRKTWEAQTLHAAWQQSWAYGAAWRTLYGPVYRAEIRENNQTIGLAQFTARRFLRHFQAANCTQGPVWLMQTSQSQRSEAYRLLRQSIPIPKFSAVFMTPDQQADEDHILSMARFKRVMSPYSTALIDLTQDEDTLRKAMQGKWRNRLKRAEESALKIIPAASRAGQYEWLIDAEAAQQKQRRYMAGPAALTAAWQNEASKGDGATIFAAKNGAERIGAMMFLTHGKGALYQIGWSNEQGRTTNAHNLLLWSAIKKLKRNGVETLDLGGVDTMTNPGIARFKLGSGGKVRTLCGTWL